MISRSTLAAALAVLCVVSMGVSATTLESSVRTNPDDVIDLDWKALPIGEESAAELKAEMRQNEGSVATEAAAATGDPSVVERRRSGSGGETAQRAGGREDRMESASQQRGSTQPPAQVEQSRGGARPDRPPWDLLGLAAVLALLAALAAVVYRYRDRFGFGATAVEAGDDPSPWPPEEPATEVDRAWLAMVRRLDLERPWTRTPAELATAAVEAGMDPEGVHRVTAAFEDVHYGGSWITSAHRERVRAGLARLDVAPEGGHQ